MAVAHKHGMIKGSDGNFKPSNKITRAQIELMFQRVYDYKTGMKYTASKAPYTDFGSYNKETVDAISMLYELDLATGSNGKFNPTTRAHAAKILVELLGSVD
ncbi:S-layer homology domain-containing protein [Sporosarcina sp. NPDC096371]|uniref:S-layer homology domain-containing protein n=1 Tax=Sporosarcina sp. NPDC096371 TaxID=3364530 RepID=UPI003806DA2E